MSSERLLGGPGPLEVETVDAHTAGEPLRIVRSIHPDPGPIPGASMLEKRIWAERRLDGLRRFLVFEPRGHADMYGCFLTEPVTPDGDVGVLFFHNEGFSTMCGHGILALAAVGVEAGWFDGPTIRFDTPAGRVTATAGRDGEPGAASFRNVPSFVLARDRRVTVPGLGEVRCDVAFGGAYYAYLEAPELGLALVRENLSEIVRLGRAIKQAVAGQVPIRHPAPPEDFGGDHAGELEFLYGTIFVQPGGADGVHSRNVCVFADGEVDRSPTGTGVSGRAAIHSLRGELAVGESIVIESLIGTRFQVTVRGRTEFGGLAAVVPEVFGTAHRTGRHRFVLSPGDPLGDGFLLR